MDQIIKYFPNLDALQVSQLEELGELYTAWNEKINLISRKDFPNLYAHHILHSLSIAKVFNFNPATSIVDIGTGGGFPGIPLAIAYPHVKFCMIDGKGKKIVVVRDIIENLELKNAVAIQKRSEELKVKFDFVVCRAVAGLDKLYQWGLNLVKNKAINAVPNGLICLKGGNIEAELKLLPRKTYFEVFPIADFFDLKYYEEKYVIYVQL